MTTHLEQRELVWRALRHWALHDKSPSGELGVYAAQLKRVDEYSFNRLIKKQELPCGVLPEDDWWLVGPPVSINGCEFLPVATVLLRDAGEALDLCIRVTNYFLSPTGHLCADGWRFESAERKKDAPHPWPHAQRTTSWVKEPGASLLDAIPGARIVPEPEPTFDTDGKAIPSPENTEANVVESRPAIPLGCRTEAGLVLAMVASIEGGPAVRERLDSELKLRAALDDADISYLSGFAPG